MVREATVWENNFLMIFSDAVLLYEAAVACENPDLNSALAKSSVLSVNCALEAAANSFLQSIEMTHSLLDKIDRLTTIEKFDFVLQWHTDKYVNTGDSHVQAIANLIKNRARMVHPKVRKNKITIRTDITTEGIKHSQVKDEPKKGQSQKPALLGSDVSIYTDKDAKAALIALTSFLNTYINWWGIDFKQSESYLFQRWDCSINARQIMFRMEEIKTLIRNDYFLKIEFMGIHGMFDDEKKPG